MRLRCTAGMSVYQPIRLCFSAPASIDSLLPLLLTFSIDFRSEPHKHSIYTPLELTDGKREREIEVWWQWKRSYKLGIIEAVWSWLWGQEGGGNGWLRSKCTFHTHVHSSKGSITLFCDSIHPRNHKECVPLLSLFTVSQWTRAGKQLDVLPTRDWAIKERSHLFLGK